MLLFAKSIKAEMIRAMGCLAALTIVAVAVVACQPVMPADGLDASPGTTALPTVTPSRNDSAEVSNAGEADSTKADTATTVLPTVTSTSTGASSDSAEAYVDEELVAAGMLVYREQYCGICHTFRPAGTTGRFGPAHDGAATIAEMRLQDPRYSGEAESAAEYIYESLVKPDAYFVEGYVGTSHSMPPYFHLSDKELHALVALLMAQR